MIPRDKEIAMQKQRLGFRCLALLTILNAGVALAQETADDAQVPERPVQDSGETKPALGQSNATAIEVCKPQGQREYLRRLICPDGSSPAFERIGSYGPRNPLPEAKTEKERSALIDSALSDKALLPGQIDTHMVDGYRLKCGEQEHSVYMDMYHCEQPPPDEAPPGFGIRKLESP
jgi:hypothetical protein